MKDFDTIDHRGRRTALALTLLASLLLVGGCAGPGGSSAEHSAGGDAGASTAEPAGGDTDSSVPAPDQALDEGPGATTKQAVRRSVTPMSRAVISTGQVTLHAAELARARSEVMRLVTSWGGTVADEQTESDDRGRITDSTLTLRVPTERFDAAMNALGGIGEVEQQSRTSEDVTTQVIDNRARVRAAERSIRSIERLLGRATRLSDIIAIESDLARRQADLDSLEQQEAYLSDQTSLSTIAVYLSRPVPHGKKKTEAKGFLAGLDSGWSGLQAATVVALTLMGTLFPFALVALLVGFPLWFVVRRRRPVATPPPAQA